MCSCSKCALSFKNRGFNSKCILLGIYVLSYFVENIRKHLQGISFPNAVKQQVVEIFSHKNNHLFRVVNVMIDDELMVRCASRNGTDISVQNNLTPVTPYTNID